MLEARRRSDANPKMLGHHGHWRGELQWIVDRNLRGLVQGVKVAALIDIVVADYVGDKNAVK